MTDIELFNEIKKAVSRGASCKIVKAEYAGALEEELTLDKVPHTSAFCAGEQEVVFIVSNMYESEFIAAQARAFGSSYLLKPAVLFDSAKAMGYKSLISIDAAGEHLNDIVPVSVVDFICNNLRRSHCLFSRINNDVYVHPECMFSKTGSDFAYFSMLTGFDLSPMFYNLSLTRNKWDEEMTNWFCTHLIALISGAENKNVVLASVNNKNGVYTPVETYLKATRKGIYRYDKNGGKYEKTTIYSSDNTEMLISELRGIVRFLLTHALKGTDKFCIPETVWEAFLQTGEIPAGTMQRPRPNMEEERLMVETQMMINAINKEATTITLTKCPEFRISDPDSCRRAFDTKITAIKNIIELRGIPEVKKYLEDGDAKKAEILQSILDFLPVSKEPFEINRERALLWIDTNKKMTSALKDTFTSLENEIREGMQERDEE